MRNRNRAVVLVSVLAVLAALAIPVLAQEAPSGPPACPLDEGIVLNALGDAWGLHFVRSDGSAAEARMGPGPGVIPEGRYRIVLASWDNHQDGDEPQLNEQWFLEGRNGTTVMFQSGVTPDLPDGDDLLIATVNGDVQVPAFARVVVRHAFYPNTESPNSVWPLCAAFVPIPDTADLGVTLVDSADPVLVGDQFTYDATVTNGGPDAATGTSATIVLPAEVALVSAPAGCVHSGEAAGGTLTCDLGGLAAGGSVMLMATVEALIPGTVPAVASATVAAAEFDPDLSDNQASEETTIEALPVEADLGVALVDSADPVTVGDAFDYALAISNLGPEGATGVVAALDLPAEVGFVAAPAGCTHSGETSDGTVTCAVGDLPVEGSAVLSVTVQALAATETVASATASVSANETDPDPANNEATEETTIEAPPVPQADLAVTVTMPDTALDLGEDQATFEVAVINNGPDNGELVVATGTLPAGFTFVSAVSSQGTCTETAGVVGCDLGSMASGETAAITIVAEPSTFGSFVFGVTVSSVTADPDLTNNVAEAAFSVIEVLPQVITTTTSTTSTTVATTTETLPFTGASTAGAGGAAAALILLGFLALLVADSRRRNERQHR